MLGRGERGTYDLEDFGDDLGELLCGVCEGVEGLEACKGVEQSRGSVGWDGDVVVVAEPADDHPEPAAASGVARGDDRADLGVECCERSEAAHHESVCGRGRHVLNDGRVAFAPELGPLGRPSGPFSDLRSSRVNGGQCSRRTVFDASST